MPDQMRGMDMGCMGNGEIHTPNLDRLASEGLLCRNTFANTPVCCPARAVILTGKYAHEHGLVANDLRLRETETTLAEILAAQGYRTGFIGKWHLDGGIRLPGFVPRGPRRQGFAFWAASECDHSHFRPVYFRDSEQPIVDHRFEPVVWTDRAIEFLDQVGDQPFLLEVAMGPPHDPYGAPDEYMRLYDPARLTMRPNWVEGVPGAGRRDVAAYYAAITAIDEQVGRLMKALEDRARAQDTIVVFISDHGNMMGSHGQRHKRKPWEESIRIPGIIRFPGKVQPGRSSSAIVTHVDLAPTLLSLCGVPVPAAMQGTDLSQRRPGEVRSRTGCRVLADSSLRLPGTAPRIPGGECEPTDSCTPGPRPVPGCFTTWSRTSTSSRTWPRTRAPCRSESGWKRNWPRA